MTRIGELVEFNKEDFFDGAIQADWFYDLERRNKVANSYIFHGPKYFGLREGDIKKTDHKLIDTATFVKKISDKIIYDLDSSRFILTIAGYGAGKSHLAVTMGGLFSGDNRILQEDILKRINSVDPDIASSIKGTLLKPNLVIVLNGMKDFNLNYEVLKCVKEALRLHNVSDEFLKEMTTAYNTAKIFTQKAFNPFKESFKKAASTKPKYSMLEDNILINRLISNIDTDPQAFEIINEVYKSVNGDYIRWDNGLTAGDILLKVNEVLCIERQIFNKIIILFDEFGRYIEYTSSHPHQAGESALQQIFEAVQNASKNIIFVGFIQSDLNAYLTRVDNANIVRYVGRYESSDKYYLSSNFETILANLLSKKDLDRYESVINSLVLDRNQNYNNNLFNNIQRWAKESKNKAVWSDKNLFEQVILKGSYPIHPLTIWIMSNLSTWMQQRSTITFVEEMLKDIEGKEVADYFTNYIFPIKLIDSKLFSELLNAEEKGLQQSQNCMLYNIVLTKYGEKFDNSRLKVIQGILIANISKFTPYDRLDMITLLKYCTGMEEKEISEIINDLEENYGLIRFDESFNRFEMLVEGNGRNEFNRKLFINRSRLKSTNPLDFLEIDLEKEIGLDKEEETSFALDNHISSFEWKFNKQFINCRDVNEIYVDILEYEISKAPYLEANRGTIVFVYVDSKSYSEVERIQDLIKLKEVNKKPIIFILINDNEDKIKDGLIEYRALKEFTADENQKYNKFIVEHKRKATNKVISNFLSLARNRMVLNGYNIEPSKNRLSILGNEILKNIYSKTPVFNFDGFEKCIGNNIKRYYGTICRGLITNSITNKQGLQGLAIDVANRLKSSLSVESEYSWRILSKTGALIEPQEGVIKEIYNEVNSIIDVNKIYDIKNIFAKYLGKPYGMNQYSLGLFIAYFIGLNSSQLNIYDGVQKLRKVDFANEVYSDKKLDFTKLMKCRIEKTEGNRRDEVNKIINRISNTIHVEDCVDNIKILRTLENEEIDDISIATIELLIQKMQRGIELKNSIEEEYNRFKQLYEKYIVNNFNLKVINYFNSLFSKPFDGKIQGSDFEYSLNYKKEMIELKEAVLKEIDNKLEGYLKYNYIFSYEDIKSEEKRIIAISNILNNVGRENLSNLVIDEFSKKKNFLIEQQKYIAIFNEFENFIRLNSILSNKNYKDLDSLKEDVLKWNTRIGELKISPEKKREFTKKLVQVSEKINIRRSELDLLRDNIINQIIKIESVDQINEVETKVSNFLTNLPEQGVEIKLRNVLDLIKSYKIDIKQLEINSQDRSKLEEISLRIDEQYGNTFLCDLVNKNITEYREKIEELDADWVEVNITNVKNRIFDLSVEECEAWKRNTANVPLYLKKQSLDAVQKVSLLVSEQIKKNKVEGIISIFKELDMEEKERCIKILHSLLL